MSRFSGRQKRGAMQRHRETKRAEAKDRQSDFDADVARVAYDHNISEREARRVVTERRRFTRRMAERAA